MAFHTHINDKYLFSADFKLDWFKEMIFSYINQSCDKNECIFYEKCQKGLKQLYKLDRFRHLIQFCLVSFIISKVAHANPRCHGIEILGKYI